MISISAGIKEPLSFPQSLKEEGVAEKKRSNVESRRPKLLSFSNTAGEGEAQ